MEYVFQLIHYAKIIIKKELVHHATKDIKFLEKFVLLLNKRTHIVNNQMQIMFVNFVLMDIL